MSDAGLRAAAAAARREGLRVAIKPHVNVLGERASRTTIDPPGAQRDAFWTDYRRATLDYAKLAREVHADWFVVGTELSRMTSRPEDVERWLSLIRAVRERSTASSPSRRTTTRSTMSASGAGSTRVTCDFFFTGRTFSDVYRRLKHHADLLAKPYFFTEIGCRKPGGHQAARFKRAFAHAIGQRDSASAASGGTTGTRSPTPPTAAHSTTSPQGWPRGRCCASTRDADAPTARAGFEPATCGLEDALWLSLICRAFLFDGERLVLVRPGSADSGHRWGHGCASGGAFESGSLHLSSAPRARFSRWDVSVRRRRADGPA